MIPVTVFAASDGSGVSESVSLLLPAYAVHFDKPGGGPWRRGGTSRFVGPGCASLRGLGKRDAGPAGPAGPAGLAGLPPSWF